MIINVVPWLQSCAQLFYSTRWPQLVFRVRHPIANITYDQRYAPIKYETPQNGIKLVLACIPGRCVNEDSGTCHLYMIYIYKPDGTFETIYSDLSIYGWSGILWSQIYVVNAVTA
jgi:hypothetical protein